MSEPTFKALELDGWTARAQAYDDWLAVNGVEAEVMPGGAGAVLTGTLSESVATRFRPRLAR